LLSAFTVGSAGYSWSFWRGTAERPLPLPYSMLTRPCPSSPTLTRSRGSLRTASAKWRAWTAARPGDFTVAGTVIDVVTSRSVPVMRRVSPSASSRTVERIGIVLFEGTEARAVDSA
jgi:hypothetical protein